MLNREISSLINFAYQHSFIDKKHMLQIISSSFNQRHNLITKYIKSANMGYKKALQNMIKYKQLKSDLEIDIFTDELSSQLIGDPEYIQKQFESSKNINAALKWYEKLCIFTTYIKQEKISKNILFGNDKLIVTLNRSKPVKTIDQIENASKNNDSLSVLSHKQVGLKGTSTQSPRMAHRIITLPFNRKWFLQYSPYQYFDKHSIVVSYRQTPIKIDRTAVKMMMQFVDNIKKFNISLNADLPVVGGSILNHMHFQSGAADFPIYKAKKERIQNSVFLLDWPIATFMIKNKNKDVVLEKSMNIIKLWRNYHNKSYPNIFDKKHNTVSLHMKKENNQYIIFILLRNNKRDKENPTGIFHVPKELQIIKKENIGIIEACGYGVFPGNLEYKIAQKSHDKDFLHWKDLIGGFKNKSEYHDKILLTFKKILEQCSPFKLKNVKEDFIKEVIKNV